MLPFPTYHTRALTQCRIMSTCQSLIISVSSQSLWVPTSTAAAQRSSLLITCIQLSTTPRPRPRRRWSATKKKLEQRWQGVSCHWFHWPCTCRGFDWLRRWISVGSVSSILCWFRLLLGSLGCSKIFQCSYRNCQLLVEWFQLGITEFWFCMSGSHRGNLSLHSKWKEFGLEWYCS